MTIGHTVWIKTTLLTKRINSIRLENEKRGKRDGFCKLSSMCGSLPSTNDGMFFGQRFVRWSQVVGFYNVNWMLRKQKWKFRLEPLLKRLGNGKTNHFCWNLKTYGIINQLQRLLMSKESKSVETTKKWKWTATVNLYEYLNASCTFHPIQSFFLHIFFTRQMHAHSRTQHVTFK